MSRTKKTTQPEVVPQVEDAAMEPAPETTGTAPQIPDADPADGIPVQPEPEAEKKQQEPEAMPPIEEIPLPFSATTNVALAVLRNAPVNNLMDVKPVGTLPQGTKVVVVAMHNGGAQLRNGLWIKAEFLTPDAAKGTP